MSYERCNVCGIELQETQQHGEDGTLCWQCWKDEHDVAPAIYDKPQKHAWGFPVYKHLLPTGAELWYAVDGEGTIFARADTWHECEDLVYEEISRRYEQRKARRDG